MVKVRIEGRPSELRERGDAVLGALAGSLRPHAPELALRLEKAVSAPPEAPPVLRHRVLQDGVDDLRAEYQRMLKGMLDDIGEVLDQRVTEIAREGVKPDSP